MTKKESLIRMAETRKEWCVSVYMPVKEKDAKKSRQHLKNLMFEAEKKLHRLNVAPFKIDKMLGPIEMLLTNSGFWENRTEGFVVFFTLESFAWYSLQYEFEELVVVTDRFHLKPLLRNTSENGRFYLLALSENQIRLFEASELGINDVYVKGLPKNLGPAVNSAEKDPSPAEDAKTKHLAELFRRVDKAITDYLKDERAPLILAGAEELHPIYHGANNYPHLINVGINGSSDKLTNKQLLKRSLTVTRPVFRRKREQALEIFREKIGTRLASNNLKKIFTAARAGRIETLFVPVGKHKWGNFDPQTDRLEVHGRAKPGDKDLLCVASSRTLRNGGEVFVVRPEEMPADSSIAAVFRY